MENFNVRQPVEPALIIATEALTIDYIVKSINIENSGNENGIVTVNNSDFIIAPGRAINFFAGENGYYQPNTFSVNPIADGLGSERGEGVPVPLTEFTIIINK